MPLNAAFIGRTYGPTPPYEVSREKIREFALATGDPNPAYLDTAAAQGLGYADVIAPPTFLTTVTGFRFPEFSPVADPELGLDWALVVHGEQSFQLQRPVVAGDWLQCVVTVAEVKVAGRNELIVLRSDVTDADGSLVATAASTLVSRGDCTMSVSYDSVEAGQALPSISVALTRLDLVRYAGASGDFNPIHTQESAAKAVGLPDLIAHGMLTMGTAVRVVTQWVGDPGAVLSYGVRFSSPVVVPEGPDGVVVEVGAVIGELLEDNQVRVDLTVTVNGSKVLLGAKAVVQL